MNEIFKKILAYGGIELLNKSIPFILLPILTRYLTPGEYGTVTTYQLTWQLLSIVLSFGFTSLLTVGYHKNNYDDFINLKNQIFSTSFYLGIIIFIISCISIYSFKLNTVYIYILLSALLLSLVNYCLAINQTQKKIANYAIIQLILTASNMSFSVILVVYLSLGIDGRLIGFLLSPFFALTACFFIKNVSSSALKLKFFNFSLLKNGTPLLIHQIINWSRYSIDKYMILFLLGNYSLGIYNINFQLAFSLSILVLVVNRVIQPILFEKLKSNKSTIKIFLLQIAIAFFGLIFIYLLIYFFGAFIIGSTFTIENNIFITLLVSFFIQGIYLSLCNYLYYYQLNKQIMSNSLLSLLSASAIPFTMIYFFGFVGAAYGTLFSTAILTIFTYFTLHKNKILPWDRK
ncbi:oligosaccharide flippase family protein [Providencia vermicola]|uniref:lipopolysaccharide biosynthesis protein n=1 Tax=Providencia vermicola TaxID=333965 RepID=UPI0032D9C831